MDVAGLLKELYAGLDGERMMATAESLMTLARGMDFFAWAETAHAAAEGPRIESSDMPPRVAHAVQAAAFPRKDAQPIVLDEFLAQVELELVTRALAQAGGNKTQAARLLGMNRPRFYRRLAQLGLADE